MFECTTINNEGGVFLQVLKQYLDQLCGDMGMTESLAEGENGVYTLHLEPDLDISLSENPESGISLYTVLCEMPEEDREDFLLKAMTANLFGRETGGSVLGLNREGKKLTFSTFLPEALSYRDFHDTLEDFVNYADAWKSETEGEKG